MTKIIKKLLLLTCVFLVSCSTITVKFDVPNEYKIYLEEKSIPNKTAVELTVGSEKSVKIVRQDGRIPTVFGVLNVIRATPYTELSDVKVEITDSQIESVSDGTARIIKVSDPEISNINDIILVLKLGSRKK